MKWKIFKESPIFPNARWAVIDHRGKEHIFRTGEEAIQFTHFRLCDLANMYRSVNNLSGLTVQELRDLGDF